jgi:TonB-linked SusC/RagA family outer membrane protein
MFMKKFTMLIVCLLSLGIQLVSAQNKTLTGTVISSEDNQPLPGVNVIVKGTTMGTITDFDGNFSLSVPADAETLVFSFMGMQTQEVAIGTTTKFNVTLDPESIGMDEVVVVAYGTAKKSSFTGSASQVKGAELEKMKVSDVSKALEGKVAGVQSSSSSGTPGSSAKILIRGIGSISASQNPLIVVDGVPYEGSLNSISQQDIESYTILKDAAANSMYGARGSNGVIIITTKKGKSGKPQINAEANLGFNARGVGNYDVITDPGDYYEMMFESYRNSLAGKMGYITASEYAAKDAKHNFIDEKMGGFNIYKGVDKADVIDPETGKLTSQAKAASKKWNDSWLEDPFKIRLRQEYNANVSGGGEVTNAYLSISYLDDNGYVENSGFKRAATRLKVEHKLGSNIRVEGNVAYAKTDQSVFSDQVKNNYSNLFMFSQNVGPVYPIYKYDEEGNVVRKNTGEKEYEYMTPYAANSNPMAQLQASINKVTIDNMTSRGLFEVKFLKDFKFTTNIAYDLFVANVTYFQTPIGGDAADVGGRSYKESQRYGALNANQLLDYSHDFGLHNVKVLLGHEIKKDVVNDMEGEMTNFVNPKNPEFANASKYQNLTSASSESTLEGFMSRVEYNYNDRYYLTASIRRDASSQFHPDSRWGTFWAVGGAWRIKEENFMRDIEQINSLKLKASYGTQGNNNLGLAKVYEDLYEIERVNGEPALTKVLRGNPDLTWEKSVNFNAGFESRFYDRFDLNVDFFIKETRDMIYQHPLPSSEGNPSYTWKNEMNMKNTGVEIEAIVDIYNKNDIKWDVTINGMTYKNKLTKLADGKPDSGYQAGSYWRKKGGSLYDWYAVKYAGVDPTNGKAQYWKVDPETGEQTKVYTNSDATYQEIGKSAIPDWAGGISTSVEAYGFDLSISTAYQIGGWVWDSFYQNLMNAGYNGENFHKDMFNRWTPGHTDTDVPALSFGDRDANASCDRWLTKASYFSIKNVTLGYSLPSSLLEKYKIEKIRFYITGDNIWLFSKRKGLDPRQSFSGATGYVYSALSTYSAGVKITF